MVEQLGRRGRGAAVKLDAPRAPCCPPRMRIFRITQLLTMLGITALFGCGPTMSDLKALNPQAATLQVRCHPGKVPEHVKLMALQSGTDHIVTDDRQDELMGVAPIARVFIEFKDDAPIENALIMASEYGLSCPNMPSEQPADAESESLRGNPPCPAEVTQSNGQPDPNLLAAPGNPDCDPPGQANAGTTANSGAKSLQRIAVCVQPPGITSTEWYGGPGIKAGAKDKATYDAQVAKATVLFYLDPNAPPESIWNFGPDTKVRCPGKPEPLPFGEYAASQQAGNMQQSGSSNAKKGTDSSSTTSAPTNTTTATSTTQKKGEGKTTDTSSPTGKGPPLSTFEKIARNMNLLGAVANMDTSGNPKHPEGDRHGMVNGTNVGGWSFPALQFGLSAIQVITAVGVPSKEFVLKIFTATKGGQRVIINGTDKAALQMADELIKEAGQYELAKGFQEISAVLPFKLGQKFTAGLESKFQAHKIFEKQAFKHYPQVFGKEGFKEGFEEAIEKAPSVILTDAEHEVITNALNGFWREAKKEKRIVSQKELRALYQKVYKAHPHWLQAIEHLLRQVP